MLINEGRENVQLAQQLTHNYVVNEQAERDHICHAIKQTQK